jgi:hypothetical protein
MAGRRRNDGVVFAVPTCCFTGVQGGESATYLPVVEAPASSGLAGVALKAGITSLANQLNCSRIIFWGVPTLLEATFTYSSAGYFSSTFLR